MTILEKFFLLKNHFQSGEISVEELPLNLEPLLWQASRVEQDQKRVRKIMNDLELVLFTLPAEKQKAAVVKVLEDAEELLSVRDLTTE